MAGGAGRGGLRRAWPVARCEPKVTGLAICGVTLPARFPETTDVLCP